LVTGAISWQTWDRVIDAVDVADRDLATLDEARLELLAAHLDMVVRIGDKARQRRMLATEAGPAIRVASRRYGPRHALAHRMRAVRAVAINFLGVDDAKGRRAADRVAKAMHRHGPDSDQAIRAELHGIDALRNLLLPELAAARCRELVDRLPENERRARIAADLSNTCFELGEMEAALHCFEVRYADETALLDPVTRASVDNARGGLLIATGAPAEAESVLRAVLDTTASLPATVKAREIEDAALANLGDAMLALGRWQEAYDYYLRAYRIGRGRARFNSAVHAARAWQEISVGP
jgi:tetratricopeptide (TPR) repeat protein